MNFGHRFASWLATKAFGEPDDLNRAADCPPYMKRWRIWASPDDTEPKDPFRIYLHRFDGDDWAIDMHDHPKKFWSIGLWGCYWDISPVDLKNPRGATHATFYQAPWVRSFPADYIHRIELGYWKNPCWTLVFTGPYTKGWGFFTRKGYMPSRDYFETELRDCTGEHDNAG